MPKFSKPYQRPSDKKSRHPDRPTRFARAEDSSRISRNTAGAKVARSVSTYSVEKTAQLEKRAHPSKIFSKPYAHKMSRGSQRSFSPRNTDTVNPRQPNTSWSKVSNWYSDLVGESGHYFHQHVILPNLLKILKLKPTDSLVDLGCGEGVLERSIPEDQKYLGIDIADGLLKEARKKAKSEKHRFLLANVARPLKFPEQFTKATCILALQNMVDGKQAIANAGIALEKNGQLVIVLNHPCFRIPRQSSWETDEKNKLQYRRINMYQSELEIPIQMTPGQNKDKMTWSYHHPLSTYFGWLKQAGFLVEDCQEWVSDKNSEGKTAKMENRSRSEIPMFLCLVARKM